MIYIADHTDASALHLVGHLCLFLDGLIQSSSTRREVRGTRLQDFYIQEAVNFMERNYQRELTVEEIADVCKLITRQDFLTAIPRRMNPPAASAISAHHRTPFSPCGSKSPAASSGSAHIPHQSGMFFTFAYPAILTTI